jgi:hypothetical protein
MHGICYVVDGEYVARDAWMRFGGITTAWKCFLHKDPKVRCPAQILVTTVLLPASFGSYAIVATTGRHTAECARGRNLRQGFLPGIAAELDEAVGNDETTCMTAQRSLETSQAHERASHVTCMQALVNHGIIGANAIVGSAPPRRGPRRSGAASAAVIPYALANFCSCGTTTRPTARIVICEESAKCRGSRDGL